MSDRRTRPRAEPGVAHNITEPMWDVILAWFATHLAAPKANAAAAGAGGAEL